MYLNLFKNKKYVLINKNYNKNVIKNIKLNLNKFAYFFLSNK